MKKYLRFFLPMIGVESGASFLILLLVWLAGFHDWSILSYGFLLFALVNLVFLIVFYGQQRNFWQYMSGRATNIELTKDLAFLSNQVAQKMEEEVQRKEREITDLKAQQAQYQEFMNLWIHQMKTPVTVIDLLAEEEPVDVFSLKEENDRLKSGLEMALNLVRVTDFQQDFVLEELSVADVVKKAIGLQKTQFIRRTIYPQVTIGKERVISDEKWLLFVLQQIIGNSLKYSPAKSTIQFSIETRAKQLILTIQDKGMGIPQHDLKRVTQAFYTGENGRLFPEATGMGLYLVAEITQKLAIQLDIQSTQGEGTQVRLIFNAVLPVNN
jgi:signal transduction histidine kinase